MWNMLSENMGGLFPLGEASDISILAYMVLMGMFAAYFAWRYMKWGILALDTYFMMRVLWAPLVCMFPFAFSELNMFASGNHHWNYIAYIDDAFYISVIGMIAFVIGGVFARSVPIRPPGFTLITRSLNGFWLTRTGGLAGAVVVGMLLLVTLKSGLEAGHARDLAMSRLEIRPLYNLLHTILPFVATNILIYAYARSSTMWFSLGFTITLLGLITGARSTSVGVILTFVAIIFFVRRYRGWRPFAALVLGMLLLVFVGSCIGWMRRGVFDLSVLAIIPFDLLYGNNFSDTRDFAWILSGWNGEYLLGKTMISGYLAFIPSAFFPFRQQWGWGPFSTVTAGLNPEAHPGLRPGVFGESFFNFGVSGVVFCGIILGFVLFRLMHYAYAAVREGDRRKSVVVALAAMIYMQLATSIFSTPSFFSVYILLFLIFIGELVVEVSAVTTRKRAACVQME